MNRARVPFIVSTDLISLGLFPLRLVRPVVVRNERLSLKQLKGCSVREEAPTRCGGHVAWDPPLGKWGRHVKGQHRGASTERKA